MTVDAARKGVSPVLDVEQLRVEYRQGLAWHAAVNGVGFQVGRGEAFGLVGESGSGKSSVAMAVLRYLPPGSRMQARTLSFEGRDLAELSRRQLRALRGDRIAAVTQHPSSALNPSLTVGRQIGETLRAHRAMSGEAARQRSADLLDRVRIRNARTVLDLYAHELSGGMQQRVMIAMALALDPALLVLDEPTTAVDASVRAEIVAIFDDLRREHAVSLLLISHDIDLIRHATDRVGVMKAGTIVESGDSAVVFDRPDHPYTQALVASVPRPAARGRAARRRDDAAPILRCRGLGRRYGETRILSGIDLDIAPDETFGLIGESGSGKSTLARLITGLTRPSEGTIEVAGSVVSGHVEGRTAAQRQAVQMVFQSPDATLNPRHRVGRILAQPLRRLARLRGAAVPTRAQALIEAMLLPADALGRRPRSLSGGQRQRVAIARAFAGKPRLVVLDEPTSALDLSVQAAILDLIDGLQRRSGAAYLFISHDLAVIRAVSDRVGVLYSGRLVETGPADRLFEGPNHPYTRLLLEAGSLHAEATPDQSRGSEGAGCVFAARCGQADARCRREDPPVRQDGPDHRIACWRDLPQLGRSLPADRLPAQ